VTNISKSYTYKTAAKINWHRYGTKLRHCHPMYSPRTVATTSAVPATKPEAAAVGDPQDGRWKIMLTFIYSMPVTVRNQRTKVSHTAI